MQSSIPEDYRDLIKERFEFLKSSSRTMSFQQAAQKLKTSKSYLKLVIDKKRHISLDKAIPLAKYLKLSQFETQILIFSFLRYVAENDQIKEFFSSVLSSYLAFSRTTDAPPMLEGTPDYKSINHSWIEMAIVCLAERNGFQADAAWIHKKLGGAKILSLKDTKQALSNLIERKFIVSDINGYRPRQLNFKANGNPFDHADQRSMMLTGLKRTEIAINQKGKTSLHRPNRHHTYCLNVSAKEAMQIMQISDEFIKRITDICDQSSSSEKTLFISSHIFSIAEDC